jgi:3',5'-cyclic AMP phosphodiesterase CpdA
VRIAHLSDLHLLSLEGAVPFRLFNKRLTGYINIRLHRGSAHRSWAVHAAAEAIRAMKVDHVVVTGDVSNLALEGEFELVRQLLEGGLGLGPEDVSLVPGNHDAYTAGAFRTKRFLQYLEPFTSSDLPELATPEGFGRFPFVRLRGPVAIIGLSTARPRPPLMAAGSFGSAQLAALERVLAHPEVARRTPVLLQHHPWHNPPSALKSFFEGLWDAPAQGRALDGVPRGLLLHGHLHRRIHQHLTTSRGHIDAVGATSASLLHHGEDRMAAFNLYDIGDDGHIRDITSHRLDPELRTFHESPIPRVGAARR